MNRLNRKSRVAVAGTLALVSLAIVFFVNFRRDIVASRDPGVGASTVLRSVPIVDPQRRRPFESTASSPELMRAIHLSAAYLRTSVGDDGRFVYRVNLDPHSKPPRRYNMLRHAGAIYALAEYQRRNPSEKTQVALHKAIGYLRTSFAPVTGPSPMLAVWSDSTINGLDAPRQCKLGAAGLALIALCTTEDVLPGSTELDELRSLGRFLLFMQNADGSYTSKYVPSTGGRDDRWRSLYYPGEAALGLIRLYERDPSPEWLRSAARALAYLARVRKGRRQVPADHWALLATARLLPLCGRSRTEDVDRDALEEHAAQICESILNARPEFPTGSKLRGGFVKDGRTCPTATRLEGLLAGLECLSARRTQLRERVERTARTAAEFLLRCQLVRGKFAGGMPRAMARVRNRRPASARFNRRAGEIRIDYVQHALCAWMQYRDRLSRRGAARTNDGAATPVAAERPPR
ncbi:MAG: hypothetical protein ACE5KM_13845 [Planctomycetaceae bacterium]